MRELEILQLKTDIAEFYKRVDFDPVAAADMAELIIPKLEKYFLKLMVVREAARHLLTSIYGMGSPEEIKELSCYDEIEDLELALTALD